jgi:hypothetical protein
MLGMSMLVMAAVACGDDDDGESPDNRDDGGAATDGGGGTGGRAGSGGRSGTGGGGGMTPNSFEVTLDGCCTAAGVCGYISELRRMCITQSDLLDPPISAGPACDGPSADEDGGTDQDAGSDQGLPPVDPDCPTYTGTYTPAAP